MVSSCSKDTDLYDSNIAQKQYEQSWTEKFGEVAADQDWNLATQVTANVDLTGIKNASTIKVYSSMPGGSDVQLIANYPATTTSFSFDYVKGASDVYVVVEDADGYQLLSGYYDINSGAVAISKNVTKARSLTRAGDRNVTLGDKCYLGQFNDSDRNFDYIFNYQYDYDIWNKNYSDVFDLYKLKNSSSLITSSYDIKLSDLIGIVGTDGVFNERGKVDGGGDCNLIRWKSELHPENGVTYGVKEDGEVNLTYFYYGTGIANPFGYFYYTDDMTTKQIARVPKYIITENSCGQNYIKFDGNNIGYSNLSQYVMNYKEGEDHTITTANVKLVYFGKDGKDTQGTYTFPKGTKIGFFIILGCNVTGGSMRYSLPALNKMFNYNNTEGHPTKNPKNVTEPWQMFITYKYGGKVIMGVEDTNDDDVNDLLFYVDNVESSTIPEIGKEADAQSWIIACEDLGSTDDYDFNDVVVEVSYVAGDKTLSVTPLAAGGTLKANISFLGTDLGEIHELLNGSAAGDNGLYPMINTTGSGNIIDKSSLTFGKKISLGVQENGFSMSSNSDGADNMGGFTITVSDETGAKTIKAPTKGGVPQMFVVPATWAWPTERTGIETAYPKFSDWNNNAADYKWYIND